VIDLGIEGSYVNLEWPDADSTEKRLENVLVLFTAAGPSNPGPKFIQDGHTRPKTMP
jgi:hypothetical protein